MGRLLAVLLVALAAPPAAQAQEMRFDARMQVAPVCFTVTNPAHGRSTLYGQRFSDGPVGPLTPAIVLVHGIASSTLNWDFSPRWSVARALASAGYVVFSYDRLGYARSSYFDTPGGGATLTTAEHQRMLHEVVGAVKTGGYVPAPAPARTRPARSATRPWRSSATAPAAGSSPAIPASTTTSRR